MQIKPCPVLRFRAGIEAEEGGGGGADCGRGRIIALTHRTCQITTFTGQSIIQSYPFVRLGR